MMRSGKNIREGVRRGSKEQNKDQKRERKPTKELISFLADINRKISENASLIRSFVDSIPVFDENNIQLIPEFINNLLEVPEIQIYKGYKGPLPPHIALKIYRFCLELITLIRSRSKSELIQNSKYRDLLRFISRHNIYKYNIYNTSIESFIEMLITEEERGINSLRQRSLDILEQEIKGVIRNNNKEFPRIEYVKSFFKNYIKRNIELPPGINLNDLNDDDFSVIYNLTIRFLTSEDINDSYSYDLLYAIAEAIRRRLEGRRLMMKIPNSMISDEKFKNGEFQKGGGEYEIIPRTYGNSKVKIRIREKNKNRKNNE
jgi:hypothetical protein